MNGSAAFLAVLYMREQAVLQATAKQMASAPPDQLADALRAEGELRAADPAGVDAEGLLLGVVF